MNKTEFLKYLEKRLTVLNQKERDDILSEYTQHIDIRIQSGLSEEDAIKDFGNVEELANEILSAYNVDPNYKKSSFDSEKVEETIHNGVGVVKTVAGRLKVYFNKIVNKLEGYGFNNLIKLIVKLMLIIIGLPCLLVIIGTIFAGLLDSIVQEILSWISYGFADFVCFSFMVCYAVIAFIIYIVAIFKFFKSNFGGRIDIEMINNKVQNYDFNATIAKLILWCVRIFVLIFVLPWFLYLPFSIIALGALIIFMLIGYPVIGITIACLGFNMCSIALFVTIVKYIYFTKVVKADEA